MESRVCHPALRLEGQLLLLTAGLAPPHDRIRALLERGDVVWPDLVGLAASQRSVPQLWREVIEREPERVPEQVRADVLPIVMVSDFKIELLRQRLQEASALLTTAGIPVMVLKGGGLALCVYPAFADRPMGDLDLLVPDEQVREAQSVLKGGGWTSDFEGDLDRFYRDHHHLAPLKDAASEVWLELHSDIFAPGHPFQLPVAELWARASRLSMADFEVSVPDPHDAMVHLSAHFIWSHGGSSGWWRAFRDVDALLRSGGIQWDELARRANSARARTCVYWTLRLARNLADIPVPLDRLAAFRPNRSEFVLSRLEHHLATGLMPSPQACPSMTMARWMWSAVVQPGRSGHGKARPWERSKLVRETFLSRLDEPLGRRALAQLHGLRAWRRYIAALLRSPEARASL